MVRGQRSKGRPPRKSSAKSRATGKGTKARQSSVSAGGRWFLRRRFWQIAGLILAIAILIPVLIITAYRFIDPPYSSLMARNALAGRSVQNTWIPIARISPYVIKVIVLSEDARFCSHWGVDWNSIQEAVEKARKRGEGPRGASTIPMQTAKNLFLWQSRSYVRKAIEIPLAYVMSAIWPKRRMLEIYLNIAEWAPGVFGAEAAAHHHFKKGAIEITRREAAQMAAALPNPYKRNAGRPGPKTRRLADKIERRMTRERAQLDCIQDK